MRKGRKSLPHQCVCMWFDVISRTGTVSLRKVDVTTLLSCKHKSDEATFFLLWDQNIDGHFLCSSYHVCVNIDGSIKTLDCLFCQHKGKRREKLDIMLVEQNLAQHPILHQSICYLKFFMLHAVWCHIWPVKYNTKSCIIKQIHQPATIPQIYS